jgi:ABC-type transport system substrate-binding protein
VHVKAITRTTTALAIIVIILLGGLIGALYLYRAPTGESTTTRTTVEVPDFVKSSSFVRETGWSFQYLDPTVMYFSFDSEISANVYEHLVRYNGNSSTEIIPWLAESYQKVSPTQYQFKLRQGITFQDGTPFNARAVWFSLNRVLMIDGTSGTGNHGSQAAWIMEQLLDTSLFAYFTPNQPYDAAWVQKVLALNFVEIVDPYTISISINHPTSQFEAIMASEWIGGYVSPSFVVSHDFPSACKTTDCAADSIDYTAYFDHIAGHGEVAMNYLNLPVNGAKAGTGPYYFDSVNPTTFEIVLKATPNYWGGPKNWKGPPISSSIKTVHILYVPDMATRVLDLRSGKASYIQLGASDIYSAADRDQWINNQTLESIIPGVTIHGPYTTLSQTFFSFLTNVTDSAGRVREFQPFADLRFRLAVADTVNMTDANININNRLGTVSNMEIPPGTAPDGSFNPAIKTIYSLDLAKSEALLLDAQKNPLKQFVDFDGHPYPAGTIDNSFGPTMPRSIEFCADSGDTVAQKILAIMVTNLNGISQKDNLGLTFSIALVPGGQQYTLASRHQLYMYAGGTLADYNYVIDFLGWEASSTGLLGWHNWNITILNTLLGQAFDADRRGDVQSLLQVNNEIWTLINQAVIYQYLFFPSDFAVTTSYLQGYFYNSASPFPYYASYSYAPT